MATATLTKNWIIDPAHSEVHFKVKHMMVSTVSGAFEEFEGKLSSQGEGFEDAEISFTAKTDSINTRNKDRDAHLKSDDFFHAAQFPELRFQSKSFKQIGEEKYRLIGDLTIRDITREVELKVNHEGIATDPYAQTKAGFELSGKINRKDFGLRWSAVTEAGSVVVSEQVRLDINIQLILQA